MSDARVYRSGDVGVGNITVTMNDEAIVEVSWSGTCPQCKRPSGQGLDECNGYRCLTLTP